MNRGGGGVYGGYLLKSLPKVRDAKFMAAPTRREVIEIGKTKGQRL